MAKEPKKLLVVDSSMINLDVIYLEKYKDLLELADNYVFETKDTFFLMDSNICFIWKKDAHGKNTS